MTSRFKSAAACPCIRAGISSEVISAAGGAGALQSMVSIDEGGEGAGVVTQTQKAPHEIAQVQRALDRNSFFAGLDSDQKQELIAGVYLCCDVCSLRMYADFVSAVWIFCCCVLILDVHLFRMCV